MGRGPHPQCWSLVLHKDYQKGNDAVEMALISATPPGRLLAFLPAKKQVTIWTGIINLSTMWKMLLSRDILLEFNLA